MYTCIYQLALAATAPLYTCVCVRWVDSSLSMISHKIDINDKWRYYIRQDGCFVGKAVLWIHSSGQLWIMRSMIRRKREISLRVIFMSAVCEREDQIPSHDTTECKFMRKCQLEEFWIFGFYLVVVLGEPYFYLCIREVVNVLIANVYNNLSNK